MNKNFYSTSKKAILVMACGLLFSVNAASAREQIQISGSSTVLPYAKIVADSFHSYYPQYKVPVIESGGSGAGIKEFCRGVGESTIDIVNASRPMKPSEIKGCFQNGVTAIQKVRFGYDGIVFATDIKGPDWHLTPQDLYKALAAKVMIGGKLVSNPYKNWNDIDKKFPNWPITAYIPGEKHGTREVFEEKVLMVGCENSQAKKGMHALGMNDKAIEQACIAVRKDGKAVDIDGDYSETLARIAANKTGVGVFGLAFYENNEDRLKVATINGIFPDEDTIADGQYPVSRPLFFYVKTAHLGVIDGLKDYVNYFLSDKMIGPDSPTVDYGLVPMPKKEREAARADFASGKLLRLK